MQFQIELSMSDLYIIWLNIRYYTETIDLHKFFRRLAISIFHKYDLKQINHGTVAYIMIYSVC